MPATFARLPVEEAGKAGLQAMDSGVKILIFLHPVASELKEELCLNAEPRRVVGRVHRLKCPP